MKKSLTDSLPTANQQVTDRLPTHYQQSADRFFGELFFTITPINPLFAENLAPLTWVYCLLFTQLIENPCLLLQKRMLMPDVYIISYIAASLFLHQIEAIIVCLLSYYPTVGRQLSSVSRQLTDSWPTGFLGSSSSQLPQSPHSLLRT